MHVDEEMNIKTNTTNINNSTSNIIQNNRNTPSEMKLQEETALLGPTEYFSAYCLAGACMVALTNPLWLIKTRF